MFFSGNSLNRLRLRSYFVLKRNSAQRNRLNLKPSSQLLLLRNGKFLADSGTGRLAFQTHAKISDLIGDFPNVSSVQKINIADGAAVETDKVQSIYLGSDSDSLNEYWAIDLSLLDFKNDEDGFLKKIDQVSWLEMRPHSFKLPKHEASILANAISLADWNSKMIFCPKCGSKTKSADAGHKRHCECTNSVQSYSYPRTDAVAICLARHPTLDSILLGRQKRHPPGIYSLLAGFLEPGETLEEACAREIKEESGITIENVKYFCSQPWPFPSQLMLGCTANATTTKISLDDEELEDAQWFSRSQVQQALKGEGPLRIPPPFTIANKIITFWANSPAENKEQQHRL